MTPRKLLAFAILFTTVVGSAVAADTNRPAASKADYTVALRFGKQPPLSQEQVQTLHAKALELLETSNFNSRASLSHKSISEVHEEYRQTVAGRYLLVSLKGPQKIKTDGGEVIVREIVIGLNRPNNIAIVGGVSYAEYASSLFTIDDEGRVIVHAKYSGPMCIELMKLAKKIAGDPTSPAADAVQKSSSSLEVVLIDDQVVFSTATNISVEMIFRNVGKEKMKPYDLLLGLSVVWDGKEYGRDPKQFIAYNGLLESGPKSGWR